MSQKLIDGINWIMKPLVWYSIIMLFVETGTGSANSLEGHCFFLWSERCVAGIMTFECILRWIRNGRKYPLSIFGIIDLISIIPFWVGFFVTSSHALHLVRTLRCIRMLKFFRYSRSLQLMALGFYRAWQRVESLRFAMLIIVLFTVLFIHEVEGRVQEEFQSLFNCFWFVEVTGTTVGFGDISPATPLGKVIMMLFMVAGLSIFAAGVSAVNDAFTQVWEEEKNPELDPIKLFVEERQSHREMKKVDKVDKEKLKELDTLAAPMPDMLPLDRRK